MLRRVVRTLNLVLVFALQVWPSDSQSQELEPRAFSPAPIGTTFLLSGFGASRGAVVVDAASPIQDLQAEISFAIAGGGYTFDVAGHQARILALVPYAWGGVTGDVAGQARSRALEGFGDARFKLSVALIGGESQTVEQFFQSPKHRVIGASLTVTAPVGQYESERLINLGLNRWAFKPELGIWQPIGRWTFDGSVGVWFFTANDAYFPGHATREQGPISTLQGHVSYDFPSGIWLGLDAVWFYGGQTRIDGVTTPGRVNSTRVGATLSLPMSARQSLKFTYSTGLATRRGADFNSFGIAYQLVMF
jgi:hypothetical protein